MVVSKENPKTRRISWDEVFMNMAVTISKRAACKFVETGAVYTDKRGKIISLGYNGPTEGDLHCLEVGCAKVDGDPKTGKLRRCRGAHAEISGIINAYNPMRLRGATLYTVVFPCYDCMKALNNAGIKEIVYLRTYKRIKSGGKGYEVEDEAWELAERRGIAIRKYTGRIFVADDPFAVDFNQENNSSAAGCKQTSGGTTKNKKSKKSKENRSGKKDLEEEFYPCSACH